MLTSPELLNDLIAHHLVDALQIEELESNNDLRSLTPERLVEELLARCLLTRFQAERVLQGRASELILDGAYLLIDVLGEGGMGTVFKANHLVLQQARAIKTIRPEHTMSPGSVKRFNREMEMSARLKHPNIVHAFDAGEADGLHYIAMEYVEGRDLSEIIATQGRLPAPRAAEFVRQAALGLQHAHEQGMVHRDVKPSNLLLTNDGTTVKILDMGLARLMVSEEHQASLTQTGTVMGTPDYVAPEQIEDAKHVDVRVDVYSLGCTLYQMLTAHVPFPGGTLMSKLRRHCDKEPKPVTESRTDVPVGLLDVMKRMMGKDPNQRQTTPQQVVDEIAPFCDLSPENSPKNHAPREFSNRTNSVHKAARRDDSARSP